MIYFLLGTKGQLIKTFPVMHQLQEHHIPYKFIYLGQHHQTFTNLINELRLPKPDLIIASNKQDISSIANFVQWIPKLTYSLFKNPLKINRRDLYIVHGDAFPAFWGLVYAKIHKIPLAHIEAGCRTHNFLNPFPEELIRYIVDRYADFLFASSNEYTQNLNDEKVKGAIINTRMNTVLDSVRFIANQNLPTNNPYVLVSIHRLENIKSIKRLSFIINTVHLTSRRHQIIFPIHESTKTYLKKYGLYESLLNNRIKILPLQSYSKFIHLIKNATFMITDGGGPQEETAILGTPCLLMRLSFENHNDANVYNSVLKLSRVKYFLNHYEKYRKKRDVEKFYPSKEIVDYIINHRL